MGLCKGMSRKCGSSSNSLSKIPVPKDFVCEPNAIGKSVKIALPQKKTFIRLCEVFVFGTGLDELNIFIVINSLRIYS